MKLNLISAWRPLVWGGALVGLLWSAGVQAQIRLSPTVLEANAQQGQTQGVINLSNPTDQPVRVRVFTNAFTYDRDRGFELLDASPQDLSPYLIFSPRELEIPPQTTRRVRLITRLAPDLPEGEYRTVVFTENLLEIPDGQGSVSTIRARIGANVYVRKGDLAPALEVEFAQFDAQDQQVELLVNNTGSATAHIEVNWSLLQGDQAVQTGNVRLATLLAGRDRNVPLEMPQPLPARGTYRLKGEILWGPYSKRSKLPFEVPLTLPSTPAAANPAAGN